MKLVYVLSSLAIASLAACSSAPRPGEYQCELHDTSMSKCASVDKAYKTSLDVAPQQPSDVQSVFEARKLGDRSQKGQAPIVGAQLSAYPDSAEQGMPVFNQPKVVRVWVAPYVDADGNLRAGEYTYFSTPGAWNYGGLKKAGDAAVGGMFEPSRTDKLGFKPVDAVKPKATETPPAPAAAGANTPAGVTAKAQGSSAAPVTLPDTQITQPYQKLINN